MVLGMAIAASEALQGTGHLLRKSGTNDISTAVSAVRQMKRRRRSA
jgi:hypothetical protein